MFNLGKYEEAIDSLDKAMEVNPVDFEALINKAKALHIIGKMEQALETTNKAIKIAPENTIALYTRASILVEFKKLNEAINDIDKALKNEPENIILLNFKAVLLSSMGKNNEAIEICDKLLLTSPSPENAQTLYIKACFESKEGNTEVALHCLKKAIEINKGMIAIAKDEKDFANIQNDDGFVKLLNSEKENRPTELDNS